MPLDRPIPAFYCCYLLRSTVSRGSVYVGSTPNPVRRLRQHNGGAKGGAVRTSRPSLRPWEMSCIVTGFPSHIAALQFEWAWQNPHITTHIPPESRIQHATKKKRSGHPKRPRHSVTSLLSNLHLLLRVPTFSRWPLELHFFSEDVHKAWVKWSKSTIEPIRSTIKITQDFPPSKIEVSDSEGSPRAKRRKIHHGIQGLEIGFTNHKSHVEKTKSIIDFEQEGSCTICNSTLEHDSGIYAICPTPSCESVTHLSCLSQHFLNADERALVPISGHCPSCDVEFRWIDIAKEITLRMRGKKEVEQLLKVKEVRKGKGASQVLVDSSESEDGDGDDEVDRREIEDYLRELQASDQEEGKGKGKGKETGDRWQEINDSDPDSGSDSDASIDTKIQPAAINATRSRIQANSSKARVPKAIIEDSDWDDAEILD